MKRMVALLALALGTSAVLSAQEKSKGAEMTGMLCSAKCVKQDAGKSACDASCKEQGGDVVFVDDQGRATKVANPKMAKGKMGKPVKVRGEMMKDQDRMELYNVVFANAG
jgi:hypothetical protein